MAPPNQLHAALVSEKMVQGCPDQHSSGLPTKKKKQTLLEKITFPDSTGMPQSERVLFKGSKYTVKVVGADRKGKWLRDVLRGYRYIQFFPVNSLSEATVCETHSRPKPVQSPVATHSPPPHSKATQRKRSVV